MIILDTNVVSELLNPHCHPEVRRWIDSLDRSSIYSTAVTAYEIAFGIARLPEGKRKNKLFDSWTIFADEFLSDRILPLGLAAAIKAGGIKHLAVSTGNNCDICDVLIVGIAFHHHAAVATRNSDHFKHFGIPLIDPWAQQP